MRKDFEMTEEDLAKLIEASKPVPAIMLQCGPLPSPQENANRAWRELGKRMGFDSMTVQPTGRGQRFFTAEVLEGFVPVPEEPPKTGLEKAISYSKELLVAIEQNDSVEIRHLAGHVHQELRQMLLESKVMVASEEHK